MKRKSKSKGTGMSVTQNEVLASKKSNRGVEIKKIADYSAKKIQEGLARPTASTGKPMKDLHGGPKFMAQLSNIGGGSIATGGGGVRDGFNTIAQNIRAVSELEIESADIDPKINPPEIDK